ncbi:hypothetical protein ACS0TY_014489 [Phlomoides rotata]
MRSATKKKGQNLQGEDDDVEEAKEPELTRWKLNRTSRPVDRGGSSSAPAGGSLPTLTLGRDPAVQTFFGKDPTRVQEILPEVELHPHMVFDFLTSKGL